MNVILIIRYGLALRDHDIDVLRVRKALVNRYPLMDVTQRDKLIVNVAFR